MRKAGRRKTSIGSSLSCFLLQATGTQPSTEPCVYLLRTVPPKDSELGTYPSLVVDFAQGHSLN